MKYSPTFSFRALVSVAAIGLAAILSVTAVSTSASADSHEVAMASAQLAWAPLGEGPVQMAVLWGDPTGDDWAALLKLPAGFTPGPHSHTGAYHGINTQGTWVHIFGDSDVRSLPQGSYVMQPAGGLHNDACAGPDDCIIFLHQHAPMDFIPGTGE